MTANPNIVQVNASIQTAPTPNNLQQRGALLSQGGTNTAAQTLTLCASMAQFQAILSTGKALTSLVWSSSVVTGTTSAPHGWTNGDTIPAVISGATPSGYNGSVTITITGASTFTYPLASNPGTETVPGTVTLADESELLAMGTTYFAGNGIVGVNVLELGEGTVAEGVAALTTFIDSVMGTVTQQYAFLVPREWDNQTPFMNILENYDSVNSQLYFYVTTTVANRAIYAGHKCVIAEVEAGEANGVTTVSIPVTEFSMASAFATALKQNPSSTNKVAPLSYAPAFGATAYPALGNQAIFTELAIANVGWIATGQEGGVAGNILKQGKMSDGNFWNFWYSTDWAFNNMNLALANEVINGSATGVNPLYYNQPGIDRLQNRVVRVAIQGVAAGLGNGQVVVTKLPQDTFLTNLSNGLYLGQIVINAEPFTAYTTENPNDYAAGLYSGITCNWIPQLPFLNIIFNLNATTLI